MDFLADIKTVELVQVIFWFLAGAISFYFSIGNARVWTSISTGFFLIFWSQAYLLNPWVDYQRLAAIHYILGTVAIMFMTHGFLEYYVFTRTLEVPGSKASVYLTALAVIVLSTLFILINPVPKYSVLRNIRMIDNVNWVFLSIINLELIRKIYNEIHDSVIAKGFIAFGVVFFFIFLWKGSLLYLQVYLWDREWYEIFAYATSTVELQEYSARIKFSEFVNQAAGILSGVSVGATFIYLYRLLR